jgi:hypothetical protein
MASYHQRADVVGALLLAGADDTITNYGGYTPLQQAERGNVELLSLLDVSNKWKMLIRPHRLRRRAAVRVMMTLISSEFGDATSEERAGSDYWLVPLISLTSLLVVSIFCFVDYKLKHFS